MAAHAAKATTITAAAHNLPVLVCRDRSATIIYHDHESTAYHHLNRARELNSLRNRAKLLGFDLLDRSTGELVLNPVC